MLVDGATSSANSKSGWPTTPAGGRISTSAPGAGKTAVLRVDRLAEDSAALRSGDRPMRSGRRSEAVSRAARGRRFHFSPRRGLE